jgi:hypothetical protein
MSRFIVVLAAGKPKFGGPYQQQHTDVMKNASNFFVILEKQTPH